MSLLKCGCDAVACQRNDYDSAYLCAEGKALLAHLDAVGRTTWRDAEGDLENVVRAIDKATHEPWMAFMAHLTANGYSAGA